jgi:hypothetical protein
VLAGGLIFSACAACAVEAADIGIDAVLSARAVAVGREVVLTVTVSGGFQNLPAPRLPDLPGFNVYPSGTSTSFSFVNGRISSSKISRYTLVPTKEGTLKVPPISVEHGGSEYMTDELTLEVTAATSPPPAPPSGTPEADGRELLLKASVDKSRAYVNEQVTLTLRFYRRASLLSSRLVPPATTGFWTEELPGEKSYYTVEKGLQYDVTEISVALFPTVDGDLLIGPATWECVVMDRGGRRGDPFDLFSGRGGRGRKAEVRSERIEVHVLPLPAEGKPEGFTGAVGSFKVESAVDRKEVKVGEPLTLTVKLSGAGNISAVGGVEMPELAGFRSYDSGASTDVSKDSGVVRGSKSFSRVYIPGVPGEYVIPAVTLPYFDPAAGSYAVASSDEIRLTVVPGEGPSVARAWTGSGGEASAKDIRYIKTGPPSFSRVGGRLYRSSVFLLLQLLAPAMVAAAYAYRRARERADADPARARSRAARREARRRLASALDAGAGEGPAPAWRGVALALRCYIADVTGGSAAGLTRDDAASRLAAAGVRSETIGAALEALDGCDAAAYAPGAERAGGYREAARGVGDVIDRIERERRAR